MWSRVMSKEGNGEEDTVMLPHVYVNRDMEREAAKERGMAEARG